MQEAEEAAGWYASDSPVPRGPAAAVVLSGDEGARPLHPDKP